MTFPKIEDFEEGAIMRLVDKYLDKSVEINNTTTYDFTLVEDLGDPVSPEADPRLLELGVPVLGICYGMQLLAHRLGGEVEPSRQREYGRARVAVAHHGALFAGLYFSQHYNVAEGRVWLDIADAIDVADDRIQAREPGARNHETTRVSSPNLLTVAASKAKVNSTLRTLTRSLFPWNIASDSPNSTASSNSPTP